MPRVYQRKRGSRRYIDYLDGTLDDALDAVKKGRRSMRDAAVEYRIPLATLSYKLEGLHGKCVGGQKRLSTECEELILSTINTLTEWKIPMTGVEVRLLVKNYLDALDLPEEIFKDNMPGRDWLRSFTKRHNLTKRRADNVRQSRARISPETVNSYFDHLEKELQGIPDSNIFNYDETNLTDDPGSNQVIVKRGLCRVERIVEHSKSSTSVMFCGSADGKYLPPMIVYKCESGNTYEGWTEGGPPNTQYASTKSGWFDKGTFSKWFFDIFLPFTSNLVGPIALIGDNLGSHFTSEVIEATLQHNIKFITMPPSSTHLCQPLDVAVFRMLKAHWRKILDNWRKTSRQSGCIPKGQIPPLLSLLCSKLAPSHLKSGFSASGIYPLDRQQVLKRLPGQKSKEDDNEVTILNNTVMEMLKEHCAAPNTARRARRGRKITHGKRIVTLQERSEADESSGSSCWACKDQFCEEGDDNWIQCDNCDKWYHFQCSGLDYREEDYYTMDLSAMAFSCCEH